MGGLGGFGGFGGFCLAREQRCTYFIFLYFTF